MKSNRKKLRHNYYQQLLDTIVTKLLPKKSGKTIETRPSERPDDWFTQ